MLAKEDFPTIALIAFILVPIVLVSATPEPQIGAYTMELQDFLAFC